MFTHSVILALSLVSQITLMFLCFVLVLMLLTFILKSNGLGFITLVLERCIFGIFGIFECSAKEVYTYAWCPIKNSLMVALLVSLGIVILGFHVGVVLWMFSLGVTSVSMLVSPLITYTLYPITLYLLRLTRPKK
jgi:hypothetical protein